MKISISKYKFLKISVRALASNLDINNDIENIEESDSLVTFDLVPQSNTERAAWLRLFREQGWEPRSMFKIVS